MIEKRSSVGHLLRREYLLRDVLEKTKGRQNKKRKRRKRPDDLKNRAKYQNLNQKRQEIVEEMHQGSVLTEHL